MSLTVHKIQVDWVRYSSSSKETSHLIRFQPYITRPDIEPEMAEHGRGIRIIMRKSLHV